MSNSHIKVQDCTVYRRKEIKYVNLPLAYLEARYAYMNGGGLKGYVIITNKINYPEQKEEIVILSECAILSTKLDEIKTALDGVFNQINLGEEVKVVTS